MKHPTKLHFMFFLSAFLLILFVFSTYPFADEKAESKTEDKKERVEKADDDINKHIVESESGVYYTVQKGDTLWDLSRRFADSPWVWPDLWKENKQISNPHLIYPGEKIRLYRKKDTDEFAKKVEEKKQEKEEKPKPKVVPEREPPYYFYSAIDSIGFIKRKKIKPSGYIFKVDEDKELISFGDLVYIRPHGKTSFLPGNKYTLYRTISPVKGAKTKTYPGYQYFLTGVIEVIKKEDNFSVATVTQSFKTIKTDDLLMPYVKRDQKVVLAESKKDLKGKVIVSEERAEYFGDGSTAFIDKGSKDGVTIGQFYTVYYQDKERIKESGLLNALKKTTLTPVDFANILVLHTEEDTSTVLVTHSEISLYPGAQFRFAETTRTK